MMLSNLAKKICQINDNGRTLLKTAMERLGLSASAYDRILKVPGLLLTWRDRNKSKLNIWRKLFNTVVSTGTVGRVRFIIIRNMRNTFLYYLLVFLPIPVLYWTAGNADIIIFLLSLSVYGFLYRPIVDANRQIARGVIREEQFFEIFHPKSQIKYFRQLFFVC